VGTGKVVGGAHGAGAELGVVAVGPGHGQWRTTMEMRPWRLWRRLGHFINSLWQPAFERVVHGEDRGAPGRPQ
jgi:hypothetical protein